MLQEIKYIENNATYSQLSFPIIGIPSKKGKNNIYINKAFFDTFLNGKLVQAQQKLIALHLNNLSENKAIHYQGSILKPELLEFKEEVNYYIYSNDSSSFGQSFLWLKHDLLNILNPIMGFAEVLSESEDYDNDEILLARKIKQNADKLYKQIQNLALLQQINYQPETEYGTYDLAIYIQELNNQLVANNILPEINNIDLQVNGLVSDRIAHADYRSALESHIQFIIQHQSTPKLSITLTSELEDFHLKLIFPHCSVSDQNIKDFKSVEDFLQADAPIEKLHINSMNYLILGELCHLYGGNIDMKMQEKDLHLNICIPLLGLDTEFNKEDNKLTYGPDHQGMKEIADQLPDDLLEELKKICCEFDGLIILDEWQKIVDELIEVNKNYKHPLIERLISKVSQAIQSFDVEYLRYIYTSCNEIAES